MWFGFQEFGSIKWCQRPRRVSLEILKLPHLTLGNRTTHGSTLTAGVIDLSLRNFIFQNLILRSRPLWGLELYFIKPKNLVKLKITHFKSRCGYGPIVPISKLNIKKKENRENVKRGSFYLLLILFTLNNKGKVSNKFYSKLTRNTNQVIWR